jgi:hypothetical protein
MRFVPFSRIAAILMPAKSPWRIASRLRATLVLMPSEGSYMFSLRDMRRAKLANASNQS